MSSRDAREALELPSNTRDTMLPITSKLILLGSGVYLWYSAFVNAQEHGSPLAVEVNSVLLLVIFLLAFAGTAILTRYHLHLMKRGVSMKTALKQDRAVSAGQSVADVDAAASEVTPNTWMGALASLCDPSTRGESMLQLDAQVWPDEAPRETPYGA